jgi:hypothetical protein
MPLNMHDTEPYIDKPGVLGWTEQRHYWAMGNTSPPVPDSLAGRLYLWKKGLFAASTLGMNRVQLHPL